MEQEKETSKRWGSFVSRRNDLLKELAWPVIFSYQQHDEVDAESPMFDGSWDWHSAIQAAYCLHILYRETDDSRYMDVVEHKIIPQRFDELVKKELNYMRSEKRTDLYGLSQMLALVRERERVTGKRDLRPLAREAVSLIRQSIDALTLEEKQSKVFTDAYENLSWNLIHLHLWAEHTEKDGLREYVQQMLPVLQDETLDKLRSVSEDARPDRKEFFPPALLRLAAVSQISNEPQQIREWVSARFPGDMWVEPVKNPKTVHAAGLNFSRAYCLWHIYQATGNARCRENFAHLVQYHVRRHHLWMIDYYAHSHWVPQFGIRAISETCCAGS